MTCGYQNLHLYLLEAMKQLVMPPATVFRTNGVDIDHIVGTVLKMRHTIEA